MSDWNEGKIYRMFPREITHSILKIKIFPTVQPNKFIYAHEKNGTLSVKSTYRMIYEARNSRVAQAPTPKIKYGYVNLSRN